jgi:hypothetical protein
MHVTSDAASQLISVSSIESIQGRLVHMIIVMIGRWLNKCVVDSHRPIVKLLRRVGKGVKMSSRNPVSETHPSTEKSENGVRVHTPDSGCILI